MKRMLPFFDAPQHVMRRGALNSSYTRLTTTGQQDATATLFGRQAEQLLVGPEKTVPAVDLDMLLPEFLVPRVVSRLMNVPSLMAPGLDLDQQKERLRALAAINGRSGTHVHRDALACTKSAVEEAERTVRDRLEAALAVGPGHVTSLVHQVSRDVKAIRLPESETAEFKRFARLVQCLDELRTRSTSLAQSSYDFIRAQLLHQSAAAYEAALTCSATDLCTDLLRLAVRRFDDFFAELATKGSRIISNLDRARDFLEAERTATAHQNQVSKASVILPLAGPSEQDILAGIVSELKCRDLGEVAVRLRERFEKQVRDFAAKSCPWVDTQGAAFSVVCGAVPAESLAQLFSDLVTAAMGTGHSLYEVIDQYGVKKVAEFLFHRAEPLCELQARNTGHFQISTTKMCIVRLPPPVGRRDPEIRARLEQAFRQLTDCAFSNGSAVERDITVVRLELGWPISIEGQNDALLKRYVDSRNSGHRPHLVGFFEDSLNGDVRQRYVELSQARTPHF